MWVTFIRLGDRKQARLEGTFFDYCFLLVFAFVPNAYTVELSGAGARRGRVVPCGSWGIRATTLRDNAFDPLRDRLQVELLTRCERGFVSGHLWS